MDLIEPCATLGDRSIQSTPDLPGARNKTARTGDEAPAGAR